MLGKIFISYFELESQGLTILRYGEIVDNTEWYDGTFHHRKQIVKYKDRLWLVERCNGDMKSLTDLISFTRIEPKEVDE